MPNRPKDELAKMENEFYSKMLETQRTLPSFLQNTPYEMYLTRKGFVIFDDLAIRHKVVHDYGIYYG